MQTNNRQGPEYMELDIPSGCEDEEMSDGQAAGSPDDSDSDTATQVAIRLNFT